MNLLNLQFKNNHKRKIYNNPNPKIQALLFILFKEMLVMIHHKLFKNQEQKWLKNQDQLIFKRIYRFNYQKLVKRKKINLSIKIQAFFMSIQQLIWDVL